MPLADVASKEMTAGETDIRQAVHEAFWEHGKEIKADAIAKLNNTERYLRFMQYKWKRILRNATG